MHSQARARDRRRNTPRHRQPDRRSLLRPRRPGGTTVPRGGVRDSESRQTRESPVTRPPESHRQNRAADDTPATRPIALLIANSPRRTYNGIGVLWPSTLSCRVQSLKLDRRPWPDAAIPAPRSASVITALPILRPDGCPGNASVPRVALRTEARLLSPRVQLTPAVIRTGQRPVNHVKSNW